MILSGLTFITFSIIAAAVLIHHLLQWRNQSLVYSLLPGPRRQHPIIGDLPILVGRSKPNGINFHVCLLQSMLGLAHVFRKEGLCRIWFAHDPYVMLFTAETIEPVLTSQALIEKGHIYDSFRCWLKTGLITSTGNKWQKRRKLLTPTFHYRILDDFIPIFDQHSKRFAEKLSAHTKQDCLNIWHLVTVFALEVICETAMGMKSGSNEKEFLEYVESIIGFGDIFMKKFAKPWLQNDLIFSLTSDYPRHKKILNTLHEFTSKVLKQRKKELLAELAKASSQEMNGRDENNLGAKQRKAFLDLLLECQLKDSSLTDEDICEEVNTFMFAGHDTTSSGISWTLYHLGRHPKIQEKVYEEIQEILGDGEDRVVTLKDVNEMKYLERVIKESQRISPSVPMIARLALEDITINGYTIPKGSTLLMLIIALHHDPSVFPNPEIFNPDRFLLENSVERHPFSYIPFSAGSRNCIGQRFAMLEMKVTICNIVKAFAFESLDPPDRILQTALLILKPIDGLKLKFRKRR